MKHKNIFKQMSVWLRAFLILALAFFAVCLGTVGSAASTKSSYVLSAKRAEDGRDRCVIFRVDDPKTDPSRGTLYLTEIYLNLGQIYTKPGAVLDVNIGRASSGTGSFYNSNDYYISNFYEEVLSGGKPTDGAVKSSPYNWLRFQTNGWDLSTYHYFRVMVNYDVQVNEIVFVGNEKDGSGEPVVLHASVDGNSLLPFEREKGETVSDAIRSAGAMVDAQRLPSLSQSSFFRFGEEEAYTLFTVSEMRARTPDFSQYANGQSVNYDYDKIYGSLGNDLMGLGVAIFGMSPFGLRFMTVLASLGVLVFGFLLARRLFGSDKAGFAFALLYALCGTAISLAHFGTPLMLGVCFLMGALYFASGYYKNGLKKPTLASTVPVVLSALLTAMAICVNGAFAIPALLVIGLFIAGYVKSRRASRALLDAAIAETEEAEKHPAPAPAEGEPIPPSPRQKLGKTLSAVRFSNTAPIALFLAFLVLGTFLISILSALPLGSVYAKLYGGNLFYSMLMALAGGFTGVNYLSVGQTEWSVFYVLFRGTGAPAAVTAAGLLISAAAVLAGIGGAVYAIVRLSKRIEGDGFLEDLSSVLPIFAGVTVSLVTAAFAKGALGFLLLAYLFLFLLAGKAFADGTADEKHGKLMRILSYVVLGLLIACFVLFAVFVFSVPLSEGLLASLGL